MYYFESKGGQQMQTTIAMYYKTYQAKIRRKKKRKMN